MHKLNARVHPFERPRSEKEYNIVVSNTDVMSTLSSDDRAKADAYWGIVTQKYTGLFSRPIMLNLEGFGLTPGGILYENASLGEYKLFVGKRNIDVPPFSAGFSVEGSTRIRSRGAGSITMTADGYLVFGRRPLNVLAPGVITNLPEGMNTIHMQTPFDLIATRLEKELGVPRTSIVSCQMTGLGEETPYAAVMSSMFTTLSLTRAQLESKAATGAQGAPERMVFKDPSYSELKAYIEDTSDPAHPGSTSIAVLNFLRHDRGMGTVERLLRETNIDGSAISRTLEEFCEPLGVGVARVNGRHYPDA